MTTEINLLLSIFAILYYHLLQSEFYSPCYYFICPDLYVILKGLGVIPKPFWRFQWKKKYEYSIVFLCI